MKMPLTKKPVADAAEDRPSAAFQLCCYGGVDRRIYHKCVQSSSPASPTFCKAARRQPDSKQSQYQIFTKYKPSAGATKREPSARPNFNRVAISSTFILLIATRVIAPTMSRTIL